MPHVQRTNRGRWHLGDGPLPLGGGAAAALVAVLAILILLLLLVKDANGNFVYWASNDPVNSIGRAKINGTGANNALIGGLVDPRAVAVDSKFIYWTENGADRIGRANLDGTGPNSSFITTNVSDPTGIAVTQSGIYWANTGISADSIGHANIDGSNPVASFIFPAGDNTFGVATDQSFVYWLDSAPSPNGRIGRAALGGGTPEESFIPGIGTGEGVAVDPSFIYWTNDTSGIGRVPVGGGSPNSGFIPNVTTPNPPHGVAVNSQYVFWSDGDQARIGRANIDGSAVNPSLAAASQVDMLAAAPSNKITINSITRKKKKGTAIVNAKVPGPGQVSITNTGTEDVAATANVKLVGLTVTGASSFKLPLKPLGKTRKKLNKQVKKKGKGKVKVKAFVTFVPAGVAGVPNSQPVKTKLIKQRTRKK
jgi:hypothetical protein